jgi:phosphotransferase system enzyme I (PtsI)
MKNIDLIIKGVGVSPGISIGTARVIKKQEAVLTGILLNDDESSLFESEKYDQAVRISVDEIEMIKASTESSMQDESMEILETHIELISDPQIREDVIEKIKNDKKNANDALIEVISASVQLFQNMDDEYMSARSADVQDIGNRMLKHLNNSFITHEKIFEEDTIIVAEDISPSDALTLDIKHIAGIVTRMGGKTSHAAIIARSRGIPATAGCGDALMAVENDDIIIVDGLGGIVIVNPANEVIDAYKKKQKDYTQHAAFLKSLKNISANTIDGTAIKLLANISGEEDLEESFEYGAEGTGLFRTELLFMNRTSMPDEEEQFEFYKKAALKSGDKPLTVRTIDIGGDKQLPYLGLPVEQNPFLGYRAIRICLDRKDIFITQLKAILRASVFGNIQIMFPMISSVQEIREAKEILAEAKKELLEKNISFDKNIQTGIMIEVPSAAVTADILAKEADFFSIGTNDLCQYTLAVDRMNEKIRDLYDPFNPGVLRLINNVIEQAHQNNIDVAMCGEMASDPLATLLLSGMGLRAFSMSASSIPFIKNIILNNSISTAKEIYKKVMAMDNSKDIISYLEEVHQ